MIPMPIGEMAGWSGVAHLCVSALVFRGVVWVLFWSKPMADLRPRDLQRYRAKEAVEVAGEGPPKARNAWLGYVLDCVACQTFWVALVWLTVTHGFGVDVVATAFAHLALAEVANRFWQRLSSGVSRTHPRARGGCGGK